MRRGRERNPGKPSSDDVNVGEHVVSSLRSEQPRGRCIIGGKGCAAIASGRPGDENVRQRRERPCMEGIIREWRHLGGRPVEGERHRVQVIDSLTSEAMGKRGEGEETLMTKMITAQSTAQQIFGL